MHFLDMISVLEFACAYVGCRMSDVERPENKTDIYLFSGPCIHRPDRMLFLQPLYAARLCKAVQACASLCK